MKLIRLPRFFASGSLVLMLAILALAFEYAWAHNCVERIQNKEGPADTIPDCVGRTQYVLIPIAVAVGLVVGGLLGKGFAAPVLEKYGESIRIVREHTKEVTKEEVNKLVCDTAKVFIANIAKLLIDDPGRDRLVELLHHRYCGEGPFKKVDDDVEWSEFMRARPELRFGGKYWDIKTKGWKDFEGGLQLYERHAKDYAKKFADLERERGTLGLDEPHKATIPNVYLGELQSMRFTLARVHDPGVQINGRVQVSRIQYHGTDGYHVKFDDTWRWRDDLSLEKNKSTELDSGRQIPDELIENIEKLSPLPPHNYAIDISWKVRSEWFVDKMGNVTKLMGWPS